jgi:hypothetical protein
LSGDEVDEVIVAAISARLAKQERQRRDDWRSRIESAKAFDQVREARDVGWEQVRTKRVWLPEMSVPAFSHGLDPNPAFGYPPGAYLAPFRVVVAG